MKLSMLLFSIVTMSLASPTPAADYPTRPVQVIVAYPAGGGVDVADFVQPFN